MAATNLWAGRAASPLLPRYRRSLTFGAVLDETFAIYRRSWLSLLGVMAFAALPSAVLTLVLGGSSAAIRQQAVLAAAGRGAGAQAPLTQPGAAEFAVIAVVSILMSLAGGGVMLLVAGLMRADQPGVGTVMRAALRRLPAMLGTSILALLAIIGLSIISAALAVVTLGGVLGIVPVVALIVWAANPGARRTWLKWLIVLTIPGGLVIYFGVRWCLAMAAVVLDSRGPRSALSRSAELVSGNWFRVFGVVAVVGVIAFLLQTAPTYLVGIASAAVMVQQAAHGQIGHQPVYLAAASSIAQGLGQLLFGPLVDIAVTLLFVDLRNRREGTDLEEQLRGLAGVWQAPA